MKTMNSTKVEEMISAFRPMLKGWEIKFLDNDIKEAEKILITFSELLKGKEEHFDTDGNFVMVGHVYGRVGFKDGVSIHTSDVMSIDTVDWTPDKKDWFSGEYTPEELECFLHMRIFCATTASGSKYYFVSEELSPKMFILLGAVSNK